MVETFLNILLEMWNVLGQMAVYLLFGFLVAGVLSVLVSPQTVERHLGGKGLLPILKATLFGIPLPLCSCGVIPVATSLRKHGASRGATTSFLLSTPETGVDSIMVTYSLLGTVIAIYRPVVAFIAGMLGGTLVEFFSRNKPDDFSTTANGSCQDACCSLAGKPKHGKLYRIFEHGFFTLPGDIGIHLLVGLLVAGLISALIPPHFFSHSFLGGGIGAMLAMMLLGIPTYVCASASVPMAMALIAKGVSPGAALVFLITGPASNAASIAAIWKIMGPRTAIIYLITLGVTAVVAGMTLDLILVPGDLPAMTPAHVHSMASGLLETTSAVVLLVLLIAPLIYNAWTGRREFRLDRAGKAIILKIAGMTCADCAQSVRDSLSNCTGVIEAKVNLHNGEAFVRGENMDTPDLLRRVRELGFKVEIQQP